MVGITHPFVTLGILSTIGALGVGAIAWYQRESPGAREYTVVMIVLAVWSALYVVQLLQSTVAAKQPWLVARHALTPCIGLLFWVFAVRYTDRSVLLSARYMTVLVALGVAMAALVIWNPGSIYWVELTPAVTDSIPVVDIDFGPALWLNVGYTLGIVAAGHLFIVLMFRESLNVYRSQLTAMTITGLIEFVLALLFLSDHLALLPSLNPWPHVQLITYGMTLAVIPIGWSYVNGALFKLQPLAERTVFENMVDAVFVFDQTDRLRYTNEAARKLLDPPVETATEGAPAEVVFADRPKLLAQFRQTGTDSEEDTGRIELVGDDETRYYDLRSSAISNSLGMTTGTVVVARDVTETARQRVQLRERTEELERKKIQLERQNKRLDQFGSFVSHDLRSPIQVANGYIRLVRTTDNLDYLDGIEESLTRMNEMVEDLRKLTRVDQNALDTTSIDIQSAARQAWRQIETDAARLQIVDNGEITADREFLLHVFENLFRNSVEHGSTSSQRDSRADDSVEHGSTSSRPQADDSVEHGSTSSQRDSRADDSIEHGSTATTGKQDSTSSPEVDATTDHTDEAVTVRVGLLAEGLYIEDDGPGIPEDERDKILEHGYSTASSGTGLGLSIVTTIAEAHDWEITVSESDDAGARFELTNVDIDPKTPTEQLT